MADFDVIVVGGGGAGLSAAIEAHDAGANVIVIEADTKLGGATLLSSGVMYAAGTSVQRAAGIDDTPQAMFDYIMTLNQWALSPNLVWHMCQQSGPTVEWLISLGVDFPPDWLVLAGVDTVRRGHANGGGGGIGRALINAVGVRDITTALGTRVEALIVENGRVSGIRADGTELTGSSVVIGTGGFGNNFEMLQRLYPSVAAHGEKWVWAVSRDVVFNMGDGITIAEEIGAGVVGVDTGLVNMTTGLIGKNIEGYLPPWVILVNEEGRRFMAEYTPYNVSGPLLSEQTGQHAFAIFDHVALVEAGGNAAYLDKIHSGQAMTSFDAMVIEQAVRDGRVKSSDTLDGLAAQIGIDAMTLQQTVSVYNADCEDGEDTVFLKKAQRLFPLKDAPFYAVEVRPTVIGLTAAGLEIDVRGQVLDLHQRPIPGLYAGGEVLGCIHGKRYAGSGNSIASAVIWGRTAGAAAANSAGYARSDRPA